jgi:tetratricopeptide (TPR) repeat protein
MLQPNYPSTIMVKFTPRTVCSGLVATVVLWGLVLVENGPVVALPKPMIWVSQTTAQDYLSRGYQRKGKKDFQGAISDFTEAIHLDPQNARAYTERWLVRYQHTGDFQGAIADQTAIIRLNLGKSSNALAYERRGNTHLKIEDFQGAIADFNQVIRLHPNSWVGYRRRGDTRLKMGDFQGAIADANAVLRIDLKHFGGYWSRSWGYMLLKDYNQALADANTAIQLYPKSAGAFAVQGAAYTGLNNYQEAQKAFDQALQLSQTDGDVYYWRGLLQLKQGKNQQAIADYKQAVRLSPGIAKSKIHEDYSLIARRQQNTPAARQPTSPDPTTKSQSTTATIDPPQPTVAPTAPNVYKIAKATTLLIQGQGSGSGVIISKVGDTYFVLTAKHVVQSQDEYTVTTPSGKKYSLDYKQIKKLANLDLAVAQFTSDENLSVAQLGNSETVDQGDIIYVSGWPVEDKAITKRSQLTTEGKIAGVQSGNADGYELMYGNSTGPGMSGGPIFNSNGQVIGIHGRAAGNDSIGKVGINLGIPVHLFLRQAPQAGLNLKQLGLRAGK